MVQSQKTVPKGSGEYKIERLSSLLEDARPVLCGQFVASRKAIAVLAKSNRTDDLGQICAVASNSVAREALRVLEHLGDAEQLQTAAMTRGADDVIGIECINALERMKASKQLIFIAEHDAAPLAKEAIGALGRIGDMNGLLYLRDLSNPSVSSFASATLSELAETQESDVVIGEIRRLLDELEMDDRNTRGE